MEIDLDEETNPLPEPPQRVNMIHEVTNDNRLVRHGLALVNTKKKGKLVKEACKEVKGCTGLGH